MLKLQKFNHRAQNLLKYELTKIQFRHKCGLQEIFI